MHQLFIHSADAPSPVPFPRESLPTILRTARMSIHLLHHDVAILGRLTCTPSLSNFWLPNKWQLPVFYSKDDEVWAINAIVHLSDFIQHPLKGLTLLLLVAGCSRENDWGVINDWPYFLAASPGKSTSWAAQIYVRVIKLGKNKGPLLWRALIHLGSQRMYGGECFLNSAPWNLILLSSCIL